MDYFAGLDISVDETHICVLDREGEVVYESKTASTARAIADALESAELSSDRIRNRSNGPDLIPRAQPTGSSRGVCREQASLPGAQVACDPQDRSQ
jgi:hypothetical protein